MSNHTKKILFVDDETYINKPLIAYLSFCFENRIEIYFAETLVEAKAKVLNNKFDLIILDMLFPDGESNNTPPEYYNGIVFLKFLRNNKKLNKTPVLSMSLAIGNEIVDSELKRLKCVTLMKPADPEIIIRTIKKLLKLS